LSPCKSDILLGRGKPIMHEWLGKLQLAITLVTNAEAMNRRVDNNDLCDDIVRLLKESGVNA
jgi:hypothetical protein